MKSFKIARYQIEESIAAIRNYYIIFISIITLLVYISFKTSDMGKITSSGLEFSTIIFLLVLGLNSFKSGFFFSQSNNVSRTSFLKGLIMGILPISFSMSIIDLIINRVYNLFIKSPTLFDMIYGSLRDITQGDDVYRWTVANDLGTLFGTFALLFAAYSMIAVLGIFISMLYYRSNRITKVIISVIPVMLMIFSRNIYNLFPISVWNGLGDFIASVFGWHSRNPYMGVLSLFVIGTIFSGFSYLLVRRAVVKG